MTEVDLAPHVQLTVSSVSEFIERVSELKKKWSKNGESWGPWFRGHRKTHWPLLPKLYRELTKNDNAREADDDIREDFIMRAPSLTDRKPENPWEWYFVMQHYGAPTRLLDWTASALIGLYFAVKDNHGYHDAAVWVLDPWRLNKQAIGKVEVLPPGSPGLSNSDKKLYAPWLPERFVSKIRWPRLPVAVYPNYSDRRIVAQKSCFTIHGKLRTPLEELVDKKDDCLAKLTVPSYCVDEVTKQLAMSGIDESTVFPDLEGLGRDINSTWRLEQNSKPHRDVYTRLAPSRIKGGGVGVFAIKKIPKGTELFRGDNEDLLWIRYKDIPRRPEAIRSLYDFAIIRKGRLGCPPNFNRLTPAWFLNHSYKPNVICTPDYDFVASENIASNDELTVDYRTYNDAQALAFFKKARRDRKLRKK